MDKNESNEYHELLIKYYTENNSFIEKGIFTASSGAITVLLGYSDKIQETFFYNGAIWGFVLTLFLQLISARISKEGCNKGLDKEHPENGNKYFKWSEWLNNAFLITFMFSIALAGYSILNNNKQSIQTQLNVNNINSEQTIKTKESYMENKLNSSTLTQPENLNKVFNLPTSTQPNLERKGYNPPKNIQPKPAPKTSEQSQKS